MEKILIMADTYEENYYSKERIPAMIKSLKKIDVEYEIVDLYDFLGKEIKSDIRKMPYKRLDFFKSRNIIEINKKFITYVENKNITTLILFTIGEYNLFILPDTLNYLRQKKIKIIGVFGDDELDYEKNKFWQFFFDRIVVYTKKEILKLEKIKKNVLKLPVACSFNSKIFYNDIEDNKKTECCFIGSPYGVRGLLIKYLIKNGIRVDIYGSKTWLNSKEIRPYYKGFVKNEDYNKKVVGSKIYLGFMEGKTSDSVHINGKIFDAAKTKSFVISTYYEPIFNDYNLSEGVNIVTYKTKEELVEKINFYIDKPNLRKKIGNNLYEHMLKEFNYEILYEKIFKEILEFKVENEEKNKTKLLIYTNNKEKYTEIPENVIIKNLYEYSKKKLKEIECDYVIISKGNTDYSIKSLEKYLKILDKYRFNKIGFSGLQDFKAYYKWNWKYYDIDSVIFNKEYLLRKKIIGNLIKVDSSIPVFFNYFKKNLKIKILYLFNGIFRKINKSLKKGEQDDYKYHHLYQK